MQHLQTLASNPVPRSAFLNCTKTQPACKYCPAQLIEREQTGAINVAILRSTRRAFAIVNAGMRVETENRNVSGTIERYLPKERLSLGVFSYLRIIWSYLWTIGCFNSNVPHNSLLHT